MEALRDLVEAVKRGSAAAVSALVAARPALVLAAGDHGKTALHWAAELDHVDVARVLVDAGADLEARTLWGATPFDWAAVMGSVRVAELLLAGGASGFTLITAASLGKDVDVRAFVESGADLSAHRRRDAPGAADDHWPADSAHLLGDVLSDALYAAARNGHGGVVEYLLSRGALVDAKGVFGGTGLHWAALNGHAGTVALLVDRGASLELRDAHFDATPEGWAEEGGHTQIAATLRHRRRS